MFGGWCFECFNPQTSLWRSAKYIRATKRNATSLGCPHPLSRDTWIVLTSIFPFYPSKPLHSQNALASNPLRYNSTTISISAGRGIGFRDMKNHSLLFAACQREVMSSKVLGCLKKSLQDSNTTVPDLQYRPAVHWQLKMFYINTWGQWQNRNQDFVI